MHACWRKLLCSWLILAANCMHADINTMLGYLHICQLNFQSYQHAGHVWFGSLVQLTQYNPTWHCKAYNTDIIKVIT